MTSRGRLRSITLGEEPVGIQLEDRSVSRAERENDLGDDSPTTGASSHGNDRFGNEDGDFYEARQNKLGIFQRVITFMSRVPLLGGSSITQNASGYGALSGQVSESSSNAENEPRKIEERRGPRKVVRPAASFASFGLRRRRDESTSRSRTRLRRASLRSSSPMLIAEPSHPAGQGGFVGSGLPLTANEDSELDEDAVNSEADDSFDPPDNSPYPQVRASVAATDDISASINTPRMWVLSLSCAFVGSATNLFFSLRYPSVAITPVIALVIVHPLGRLWDKCFKCFDDPEEHFEDGSLVQQSKSQHPISKSLTTSLRLWLAQGTWNGKEHACVYISSNVSFGFAFATDVIVEQSKFYHQDPSIIYQLLLTISTQILGYAFAGLTRRFLVRPPSMIWPGTLMSTAMFTTMHSYENKPANGWSVSRWKFFLMTWSGAFAWYFLPGLLMPALSYFSVVTWFAPKNVVVANLVSRCSVSAWFISDPFSLVLRLV